MGHDTRRRGRAASNCSKIFWLKGRAALALTGLTLVSALLGLALLPAAPQASGASTPSSGSVGPSNPSANWTGAFYAAGANQGAVATGLDQCLPSEADPLGLVCDHYHFTVEVPFSHWSANTGGVRVAISWADASNDFDMYVYDKDGNLVGSSAGVANHEIVFLTNANAEQSPYEVRVVPFQVVASGYTGMVDFISQDGTVNPLPPRDTGGLVFGPATVIDAQRTEGEPINWIDKDGNYWESGPWGVSTNQSFIHRSTDGGDQFNVVSPVQLRPDLPPGGGDTDIVTDDQGVAYFTDLESLVNLGNSVSHNNGNTWIKNPFGVLPGDDRQWFAVDNGPTGAASDNTIFLGVRGVGGVGNNPTGGEHIYSTPGSTGPNDPVGGIVYTDSSSTPGTRLHPEARCGQLRFDPVRRNLYYPCGAGNRVTIIKGHVNPGQRTGIVYTKVNTPPSPGGGSTSGDLFPGVATDSAGNLYAVWIDSNDHNVYYSYSQDEGGTWSVPTQINGGDARTNIMPWAVAGRDGTLVVAWYGSPLAMDSDVMPSWYNNRVTASMFPWYGYVSVVTNAASAAPAFAQARFTERPQNYGQVCTGGLGCTITNGDRTMADFFAITLDRDGSIRVVFNDTTSQHHGAHLAEVRQLAGPTAFGTYINKAAPKNPVSDPVGDAQWPHYSATGPGPNMPQFDFTQVKLSQPDENTLRVQMTVSSLASLAPPVGKTSSLWLTRFQALSSGDHGEESYRIFYVGMESRVGSAPRFFAGSGLSAQGPVMGNGCVTTTPENCKVVQYPDEVAARGSILGNTITIDVPLQGGFGAGRPVFGRTLYSVTALSAGRNASPDVFADIDATRAFDFSLKKNVPPPPADGRKVTGAGAIAGAVGDASFALDAFESLKGKVAYSDAGAGVDFRSGKINSVTFSGNTATIKGTGTSGGAMVEFTVTVTDNGEPGDSDRFGITLGTGYRGEGALSRGNVKVH